MAELKPCPFCGGEHKNGAGYDTHKVSCSNDNCFLYGLYVYPDAWNNRPAEAKIKADAVREALAYAQAQCGWRTTTHYRVA